MLVGALLLLSEQPSVVIDSHDVDAHSATPSPTVGDASLSWKLVPATVMTELRELGALVCSTPDRTGLSNVQPPRPVPTSEAATMIACNAEAPRSLPGLAPHFSDVVDDQDLRRHGHGFVCRSMYRHVHRHMYRHVFRHVSKQPSEHVCDTSVGTAVDMH